jgi:hypothetical protein
MRVSYGMCRFVPNYGGRLALMASSAGQSSTPSRLVSEMTQLANYWGIRVEIEENGHGMSICLWQISA